MNTLRDIHHEYAKQRNVAEAVSQAKQPHSTQCANARQHVTQTHAARARNGRAHPAHSGSVVWAQNRSARLWQGQVTSFAEENVQSTLLDEADAFVE
jgi:hypothetical protein